jgi:hypothetical protein
VLRFSLRWLLVFVAFLAVGIVSLRYASPLISGCLSVSWLVFLMVAVLGAIYRRKRQRAFWVGCCVFGWSFAAYGTVSGEKTTALDQAIRSVYGRITWTTTVDPATAQALAKNGERVFFDGFKSVATFPPEEPFLLAAETLVGLVIALIGGVVSQWFHATSDREDKNRD